MKSKYLYRAGFIQTHPRLGNVDYNCRRIIDIYKKTGNDITVFPELATCGYNFRNKYTLKKTSLSADSVFFDEIRQISREGKKSIVLGFAELSGRYVYNASMLINEKGKSFLYRKTHLFFNEKKIFAPGDTGFTVGNSGNMKVGQMICFDWFFPESARTLALKKADLIAHPANLVMPYCQNAMKVRALENSIFAVTANRVGTEGEFTFTGMSQITGPDGSVLKKGYMKKACSMSTVIDIRKARDKNLNTQNNIIRDRRKSYYGL